MVKKRVMQNSIINSREVTEHRINRTINLQSSLIMMITNSRRNKSEMNRTMCSLWNPLKKKKMMNMMKKMKEKKIMTMRMRMKMKTMIKITSHLNLNKQPQEPMQIAIKASKVSQTKVKKVNCMKMRNHQINKIMQMTKSISFKKSNPIWPVRRKETKK